MFSVIDKLLRRYHIRSKDSKDSQVEDDGYSTTKNPLISLLSKMIPRKIEPGFTTKKHFFLSYENGIRSSK